MAHIPHHRRTISRSNEEWEAMKEPFRKCYIDGDMSLKQATEHLSQHHGFPASERQWERKKEQWGFSKYQKREARQHYIDQALARGMNMEDILNAPDIPIDGLSGDDRAARRNWRRYVKRDHSNRARSTSRQSQSPAPEQRRSFEDSGAGHQEHQIVEKTYDLGLPDGITPDQTTGALPDSIMLEATPAEGTGQSPVQFLVVNDVSQSTAPEIFFSLSSWDDDHGLQNHGPIPQANFPNYADSTFTSNTNTVISSNSSAPAVRGLDDTYGPFAEFQQPRSATDFTQQPPYADPVSNEWGADRVTNDTYNSGPQQFYGNTSSISDDSESFTQAQNVPVVQPPEIYGGQASSQAATPGYRAANDYFQSMTADDLTTDLSNVVDQYTEAVEKMIKDYMVELPKLGPKVLLKMIEEGMQSRRDLCLRTISKEIENQARIKQLEVENQARSTQRTLESIREKCQNLEQIMGEKNIDTRAELRNLKARRNPRHPTENGPLDMSQAQWNATMNSIAF